MCGINGFVKTNNKSSISTMNSCLSHRGPDYSGTYSDNDIILGHTLLSIRDASSLSAQPFIKNNSPWVLLFNGQLYNTAQLKKDLGPTASETLLDTALLYMTIEKYGWNFINHIHGMYSIALYNKEEKIVRLYRDPSGQKLLYYYHKETTFIFSSEIKSILTNSSIDRTPDEEAVMLSTLYGYIPGTKTLFTYIKKLNLGESITFNFLTNKVESQYIKIDAPDYFPEDTSKAFQQLTHEHLQSKEKVSINLSGGMDSSVLLHEMRNAGHEINSYTNYFEGCDEKFNKDALLARKLSEDYGANHTEIHVTKKSYLDNFIGAYLQIEEPNYNITLPAYLQTAKKEGIHGDKNRVVLSGDGGDELFAGYPHHFENIRFDRMSKLMTPFLFNIIKNRRNGTSHNFSNIYERWYFFRILSKNYLLHPPTKLTELSKKYTHETIEKYLEYYGKPGDSTQQMMCVDRALWLAGENFIRSDKLYMSESLELRSPLAYHPFRQYIDKKLTKADYLGTDLNKLFLRNHYRGKLPEYIIDRKDKSGWRSPVSMWYDKSYKNMFLSIVSEVENNNTIIDWKTIKKNIETKDEWPGKYSHLYISLALLAKEYRLKI